MKVSLPLWLSILFLVQSCHGFVFRDALVSRKRATALHRPRSLHFQSRRIFIRVNNAQALSKQDEDEVSGRTRIEDGSPLGVAIVVLGSLALLGSDGVALNTSISEVSLVWVVFGTASVVAGISRLVRNKKD